MFNENDIDLGMSVDTKEAIKNVNDFRKDVKNALNGVTREFDGLNVSAKDLQERIADLDARMDHLRTTYGKGGAASKEYAMLERERAFATEKLISLEGQKDAATQKSVRGMGSLASATTAALGSVSGLGTGISVLTNNLMSGFGLTGGLAAGVIGLSFFMQSLRDTREEAESLGREVSGLIKITTPEGSFEIRPEKIKETLDKLRSERIMLSTYGGKLNAGNVGFMPFGTKTFTEEEKKRKEVLDSAIEVLEEANKKYERYLAITNVLTETGLDFVEKEEKKKKVTKELSEAQKEAIKFLSDLNYAYKEYLANTGEESKWGRHVAETLNNMGVGSKKNMRFGVGDQLASLLERGVNPSLLKTKSIYSEIADASRDAGRAQVSAWTSSLNLITRNKTMVEQFINAIARAIIEVYALKAATAIIDFFTGGLFSAFSSTASAATSSAAGALPGSSTAGSLVPKTSFGYGGSSLVVVPVVMDTKLQGRDIWLQQRRENNYRNRFT